MINILSDYVPINFLCNHFNVSSSGYYSWRERDSSAKEIKRKAHIKHVKEGFKDFKKRYGSPRLSIALQAKGVSICENTVAKIMKDEGLVARKKKAYKVVQLAEETATDAHERVFKIEEKKDLEVNEVWAGDITYLPVDNKFLYLSVVMDLKRRKLIGWSLDETLSSQGVIKALEDASIKEGVSGKIFHSDQGVQYKSLAFRKLLSDNNIQGSMSRRGNCYDNSFVETFFKSFKSELFWNQSFESEDHLRSEIFEYIESWYNRKRIHSSLDNKSPLEYELGIKDA
jgi:transposase InsO family protein